MAELLFLAHRVPDPPDRGDKIRSHHLLKALCRLAPVHLACFADDEAELAAAEALGPMLASLHVEVRRVTKALAAARALASGRPMLLELFDSAAMRTSVARTMAERPIDAVLAFSVQMAQFVPDGSGRPILNSAHPELVEGSSHALRQAQGERNGEDGRREPRFVMDFVDVDSAKFAAYAGDAAWPMRAVYAREARRLAGFEREVAARAAASLFVSDAEAAVFCDGLGGARANLRALENGVDTVFFDPSAVDGSENGGAPLIVFTGQMDYLPNIEAVVSFARDAMPAIRAARPDVRFAIVGRRPAAEVGRLARLPGVEVIGEVADVRSWLAAADVVVAPLRTARGIQNKVLEAMAMARPVVASRAAFEGIDATPGRELIVAEDAAGEARAVLELLGDPGRGVAMGRAARARVVARYSWDAAFAPLAGLLGLDAVPIERAA